DKAVILSKRYIQNRFLPDKAIDLIDEASSAKIIESLKGYKSKKYAHLNKKLGELQADKEKYISDEKFEDAAHTRDAEVKLKKELRSLSQKSTRKNKPRLNSDDIAELLS